MDVKASARAKHASSQRGRARHSTHKHPPKPASAAAPGQAQPLASNVKKQEENAALLPSNWSRYEEEDALQDDSLSDVPAVKSKGANYSDLLSEKSMFQAPDLARGRKELMLSRGLGLWARGSYVDNIWSTHEMFGGEDSFFSLDLDFLGKELATIDIAERLFVDPKFIPFEERRESNVSYEDSAAEADDKNGVQLNFTADQSIPENSTGALSSSSTLLHQDSFLHSISAAAYGDAEREGLGDRLHHGEVGVLGLTEPLQSNESGAPHVQVTGNLAQSWQFNKIETNTKETLVEPHRNTNSMFEPKAAEAELDALLDMLDSPCIGEASTFLSTKLPGSDSSQGLSSQQSAHLDILQESSQFDLSEDASLGTPMKSKVGTLDDIFWNVKESPKVAIMSSAIPSHVPPPGNVNNSPDLDEDFDNWLDSL